MKKMTKVFALILALTMVLGLCTVASAASDGKITVRNATIGKDYDAYKVFDLTYTEPVLYNEDGVATTPVSYSYTSTEADPADDAFLQAMLGTDSPFKPVVSSTPGVYNISLASGKTASDVIAFLGAKDASDELLYAEYWTAAADNTITATDDVIEFDGLAHGYYYVTSTLGSEVTIDSTMKEVTIVDKNEEPGVPEEPTKDPNDPEKNIIYPGKAIVLEDGSLVTENSADYGDVLHFGYSLNATAYADEFGTADPAANVTGLVTYYYITDVMDAGLELAKVDDSTTGALAPVVSVVLADGTVQTLDEDDYVIRYSDDTADSDSFEIIIPWGEKFGSNATITVDYYAVVTDEAALAGDPNKNIANYYYDTDPDFDPDDDPTDPKPIDVPQVPNDEYDPISDPNSDDYDPDDPNFNPSYDPSTPKTIPDPSYDDPNPPYDPDPDNDDPSYPDPSCEDDDTVPFDPEGTEEPPVDDDNACETDTYVYALGILKLDGDNTDKALEGAKFTIEREVTPAAGSTPAVYEDITTGAATNGVYSYVDGGSVTEFVTTANGEIVVKGLAEGTYRITETEAPKGYNQLEEPIMVTITLKDSYGNTVSVNGTNVTLPSGLNARNTYVPNYSGLELPSTGGIGTQIFYIAGTILLLGAAVLLFTKKRMAAE